MEKVSRALLKKAMDEKNWDLLDQLFAIDASAINDKSLYTDTWGEWWGLLYEAILKNRLTAVNILLKHGADTSIGNWGDCIELSPIELAQQKKLTKIITLLENPTRANYTTQNKVDIPPLSQEDEWINEQGKIRDQTGLIFPSKPKKD